EAASFALVAQAYQSNPAAAKRARRRRNEPTASGWSIAGQTVTTLVCAVGIDICKDLVIAGAKAVGRRQSKRLGRLFRRNKVGLAGVGPPIRADQVERVRRVALASAKRNGASANDAATIATALVGRWTPPA